MKPKQNPWEGLKDSSPFRLPEGYFEGLTDRIMSRLPEAIPETPQVVSLYDRIRPLLYLAGVFAGLLLLFRAFIEPDAGKTATERDPLLQATVTEAATEEEQEFLDYLDYLENEYCNSAYAEKWENEEGL